MQHKLEKSRDLKISSKIRCKKVTTRVPWSEIFLVSIACHFNDMEKTKENPKLLDERILSRSNYNQETMPICIFLRDSGKALPTAVRTGPKSISSVSYFKL